jgi:hypothetical protein
MSPAGGSEPRPGVKMFKEDPVAEVPLWLEGRAIAQHEARHQDSPIYPVR